MVVGSGPLRFAFCVALLLLAACGPRTGGAPRVEVGAAAPAPNPQALADFYRGKTLTIIVGLAPGGGFDTTARLLAKHIGKHIPGNPNAIVENMPGAGSLIAANHLYNVAAPDGLTIGVFNERQVLNQITGAEGVQFDARKFGWLGNSLQTTTLCTIRSDSPYATGQDLLRKDLPPLVLGGTGPGAGTVDFPKLLTAALGANIRLVTGYGGTAEIRLAVEGREVDGLCWSYQSTIATAKHWVDTNFIRGPVYQAPEKSAKLEAQFPGAVRVEDLASDEQTKRLIRAASAPEAISRPFVAPPGLPPDRLKALQDAFWATMNDPALLADAEQIRLDLDPNPAAKTEAIVNEILGLPPDLAKRLGEILK